MPVKTIPFKPGVNRENTRYQNEGGWYECDKVRFRQGLPEKIKGWSRISSNTFIGVCRSLWNWATLAGSNLMGVGTHRKFYIEKGGAYNDITPLRETQALTDPFTTVMGDATVTVADTAHGAIDGAYVTFSGASAVGGITIDGEYEITYVNANSYTIEHTSAASSNDSGGGSVTAEYQLNPGQAVAVPITGWGAGTWGSGPWGGGSSTTSTSIRLWSQSNFGEDLVFVPRGGKLCYWDATNGVSTRGVFVEDLSGAVDVPAKTNVVLVSDISRFVFALGCSEYSTATFDPMLIRWSDQEDITTWTPLATNLSGSIRVSRGTEIITGVQARQEVLVWTDTALYGLQFLGTSDAWGASLLGDNISIAGQNAAIYTNGTAYWMGKERFYVYDGTVRTLQCDLRRYVFNDFSLEQSDQVFAGLNEAYSEVWWFYCSEGSQTIDKYVVYNYQSKVWYYGTMDRTAWIDSSLRDRPTAATYTYNLVEHETGVDDNETGTPAAIEAYIVSSEVDIGDGDRFMFIRRILPDITFDGSDASTPSVTMTLYPLTNAGSDYVTPRSVGGEFQLAVDRGTSVDIEPFTGQGIVRVRGRQMVFRVESMGLGTTWQLGKMRFDMRPDGRR